MRLIKLLLKSMAVASLVVAVLSSQMAFAGWQGVSYFEGDNSQVWPPDMHSDPNGEGKYSKTGSVMPSPNEYSPGSYSRGAVGTDALDAYSGSNYKEKFFKFLKDKNHNGTPWEKMGSGLMVHQMLGRDWGEGSRVIPQSSSDWTTLENRLVNNPNLRMEFESHSRSRNTSGALTRLNRSGAYNRFDAFRYNLSEGSTPSIVFYDESTTPRTKVYAIEIWCANPLGEIDGLPPFNPGYSLTPSISSPSDGSRVKQGGSVSAKGAVKNEGPDKSGGRNWYLTRLIYAPGVGLPSKNARTTKTNPSSLRDEFETGNPSYATYPISNRSTGELNSGSSISVPTNSDNWSFDVGSTAVGSRVCFVVSVRNPTEKNNDPVWSHSRMNCVTVDPPQFNITPTLEITGGSNRVVNPGDMLRGPTRLANSGPDTSLPVNWRVTRFIYNKGSAPSSSDKAARNFTETNPCDTFPDSDRAACTTSGFDPGNPPGTTLTNQSTSQTVSTSGLGRAWRFAVPSSLPAGSSVCFVASVSRPTQNTSSERTWRHSAMECVAIRDFALTPTIDRFFSNRGEGAVVEPGETGAIRSSVTNGGPNDSRNVEWRLTYYEYTGSTPSDKSAKSATSQDPCSAFSGGSGMQECTHDSPNGWRVESRVFTFRPDRPSSENVTPGQVINYRVPDDMDVGTKVCWVASVRPPTADSGSSVWRHSAMYCLIVGKKPKVQVWGGDVRAGGEINTSTSTIDGQAYGSWGEYAALSNRQNSGFATGSGLNKGSSGLEQSTWSELTFANTGIDPGCSTLSFGCYGFTLPSPLGAQPLVGQFKLPDSAESTLGSSVNLNHLSSGTHKRIGDVTLTGTTISQGKSIVIEATGTVTITGDIRYSDGGYSSVHDIPQVVIRAPTINIEDRVEQVDAWLFAVRNPGSSERGKLNTCSNRAESLTANICNELLTINGPVVAEQVLLRRTAGSGATADVRHEPAEIFNLRADAYLWGRGYGSHSNQVRTVHIRELAPRF